MLKSTFRPHHQTVAASIPHSYLHTCKGIRIPELEAPSLPPARASDPVTTSMPGNIKQADAVFDNIDLLQPVLPGDKDSPCLGETLYFMFEWMSRNKATDAAAKTAWAMLAEIIPTDTFPQQFAFVKEILEKYLAGKVREIDLCPNGCIAYYDCASPRLKDYQHANKEACPLCGLSRHVQVKIRGRMVTKARATMYYLSVEQYFREMFSQPDVAVHLDHTDGDSFPGNLKESRGFYAKMINNPLLAGEGRNQAVVATADGVPLFKDMTARKGHPFMLRTANADDYLQKDLYKAHLFGYIPCESWDVNEDGSALRIVRTPPSLQPMMYVFSDEMYHLYNDGCMMEDYSRSRQDAGRCFLMRVILLFWIGDYPGLGEISDFWLV